MSLQVTVIIRVNMGEYRAQKIGTYRRIGMLKPKQNYGFT